MRLDRAGSDQQRQARIRGEIGHAGCLCQHLVAQSATHSTGGVVPILAGSGLILAVASMCDQGYRFSRHKN